MADVFISYAHEDHEFVRRMVGALEAEGLSVWWDHTIPPGQSWDSYIARGIREAKAAIVVWSHNSMESDWVKEEATIARATGKYLPAQIDGAEPPIGFTRIQAANLAGWSGAIDHPQWRMLAREAVRMARGGEPNAFAPPPRAVPATRRPRRAGLALAALVAVAMVAAGAWLLWRGGDGFWLGAPKSHVAAAETSPSPPPSPARSAEAPTEAPAPSAPPEPARLQKRESAPAPVSVAKREPVEAPPAAVTPTRADIAGAWTGAINWDQGGSWADTWTLTADGAVIAKRGGRGTWTIEGDEIVMEYRTAEWAPVVNVKRMIYTNHIRARAKLNGASLIGPAKRIDGNVSGEIVLKR